MEKSLLERIERLERQTSNNAHLLGIVIVVLLILVIVSLAEASDQDAAAADLASLSPELQQDVGYFGLQHVAEEHQQTVLNSLRFVIPSCSSSVVLERQLPQEIPRAEGGAIYRVQLSQLGWQAGWPRILKEYPYWLSPTGPVIRADWFIQHVTDAEETDVYFDLLFGRQPENEADLLSLIEVAKDSEFRFGLIEGDSRVSVLKTRWIENYPTPRRTDLWRTLDFARLDDGNDPMRRLLLQLKGDANHDASELIWGIPKIVAETGEIGVLQGYALANGDGVMQEKAPASIVTEQLDPLKRTRGVEIVNFRSCVTCHVDGLNLPSRNELREYLKALVLIDVVDKRPETAVEIGEKVERFHLSNIAQLIMPHNDSYAKMVAACNGLTTADNVQSFIDVFHEYDRPLTELDAIRELSPTVQPGDLEIAIEWYASTGFVVPERIEALALGVPIPRQYWVSYFQAVYEMLAKWRRDVGK